MMTVWVDPKTGRRPHEYREFDGEMRPSDGHGNYVKTTEKVVSRNAFTRPAEIPGGRYSKGMKLIGLKRPALPRSLVKRKPRRKSPAGPLEGAS